MSVISLVIVFVVVVIVIVIVIIVMPSCRHCQIIRCNTKVPSEILHCCFYPAPSHHKQYNVASLTARSLDVSFSFVPGDAHSVTLVVHLLSPLPEIHPARRAIAFRHCRLSSRRDMKVFALLLSRSDHLNRFVSVTRRSMSRPHNSRLVVSLFSPYLPPPRFLLLLLILLHHIHFLFLHVFLHGLSSPPGHTVLSLPNQQTTHWCWVTDAADRLLSLPACLPACLSAPRTASSWHTLQWEKMLSFYI